MNYVCERWYLATQCKHTQSMPLHSATIIDEFPAIPIVNMWLYATIKIGRAFQRGDYLKNTNYALRTTLGRGRTYRNRGCFTVENGGQKKRSSCSFQHQ